MEREPDINPNSFWNSSTQLANYFEQFKQYDVYDLQAIIKEYSKLTHPILGSLLKLLTATNEFLIGTTSNK